MIQKYMLILIQEIFKMIHKKAKEYLKITTVEICQRRWMESLYSMGR